MSRRIVKSEDERAWKHHGRTIGILNSEKSRTSVLHSVSNELKSEADPARLLRLQTSLQLVKNRLYLYNDYKISRNILEN